ncbi:glycosyl-4,4'-diaponeurosporenoate acyltransferase CrtO family protein [Bizionia arctica]|uniref:Glycosyl-4,4'-diaponeurosporenoate acyltransferase n=1 Tax=Bizionia arctica TaxID=1495645 RepID=A0A917GEK7_9FLAO|nr:hypothetical protein [Bizionia arctica]GGG41530.1 hypothetical protein GCM10010976_11410 [Bizionia arctica]
MVKKFILLVASLFLLWQSISLLNYIIHIELKTWLSIGLVAFLVNLFITGVFAFLGFALPTQNLIPSSYYKVTNTKKLKKVFALMKVDYFRDFLLATFWRNKNQRKRYFDGTLEGIKTLDIQSKKSEFGHLIPFVIITAVCIYFIILGLIKLAILTLLINILGNLYPIILQRHHRMRIQILRKRMHA